METWQMSLVKENLYNLSCRTQCSAPFLQYFVENGILAEMDLHKIRQHQKRDGIVPAVLQFYNTIMSRSKAYDVLLTALEKTNQFGVLEILPPMTETPINFHTISDLDARKLISEHLSTLAACTICSFRFLYVFVQNQVLTMKDAEEIRNDGEGRIRAYRFYTKIVTRKKFFPVLIEALQVTEQTNVLHILQRHMLTNTSFTKPFHQRKMEEVEWKFNDLIQNTLCSKEFLTIFLENQILSEIDINIILTELKERGSLNAANKFYEIGETRPMFQKILIKALKDTKQTHALDLAATYISRRSSSSIAETSRKIQSIIFSAPKFQGPPNYITEFRENADQRILVISSLSCEITTERISETDNNCQLLSVIDVVKFSSLGFFKTGKDIFVSACHEDIEGALALASKCKEKMILVTNKSIDHASLFTKPPIFKPNEVKLVAENIKWADLSQNAKIEIVGMLRRDWGLNVSEKDLIDKLKCIEYPIIVKLLSAQHNILLKTLIPETPSYYIPRHLKHRTVLCEEFFSKSTNDIFVFFSTQPHTLRQKLANSKAVFHPDILSSQHYFKDLHFHVVLHPEKDYQTICKFFNKFSVHLIKFDGENFIWQKSRGGVDAIQDYIHQMQPVSTEAHIQNPISLQVSEIYPICISGGPGMGKSTLLTSIARTLQQKFVNKLVVYMEMSTVVSRIKNKRQKSKECSLEDAIETEVIDKISDTKLITGLLKTNKSLLQELLLNGFDKLEPADEKLGHEFLKAFRAMYPNTRLWITTRKHLLNSIENTLNAMGYIIDGFSKNDQTNLLTSLWTKTEKVSLGTEEIKSYAGRILDEIKLILGSKDPHFAATPLHCIYVAEGFETDFQQFSKSKLKESFFLDSKNQRKVLLDIVEKIVKSKFTKWVADFLPTQTYGIGQSIITIIRVFWTQRIPGESWAMENVHIYQSVLFHFPHLADELKTFLKWKLFDEEITVNQIYRCGLMQADSLLSTPSFVSNIFGEYFIAMYFLECLQGKFTNTIRTNIIQTVLKTNEIQIDFPSGSVTSYEFKHKVICYLIEAMIQKNAEGKNVITGVFTHNIFHQCNQKALQALIKACVASSSVGMFSIIVRGLAKLKETFDTYFLEEVLIETVFHGDYDMFKTIYELQVCRNVNIALIRKGNYSLLHFGVLGGNYDIVRHLTQEKQYAHLMQEKRLLFENILPICINNTVNLNNHNLHQRKSILIYLASKYPKLVTQKNSEQIFLERENTHSMLFTSFVQLIASNVDILEYVIHKVTIDLNSEKYLDLLNIIFDNQTNEFKEALINSSRNNIPLLYTIILNIEPDQGLREFLSLHSKQFSFRVSDESMFVAALRKQRSTTCLAWLLDHINLSDDEAFLSSEILFQHYETETIKQVIHLMNISIGYKCTYNNTYLHQLFSCKENRKLDLLEITKLLIENGVDPLSVNSNKETPFHLLATSPNFSLDCWNYLVKRKANILAPDLMFRTPISRLLENILVSDEISIGSMKYLFKCYDTITVKRVINFICSSPGCRSTSANILLHALLSSKENINISVKDLTQLLIDNGANMHYVNNKQETPLHILTSNPNFYPNCWSILISSGADICALDSDNYTPVAKLIMNFSKLTNFNYIQHVFDECNLLNNEMCVDWRDLNGNSLLHYTAKGRNVDILRLILSFGININVANNKNETPLHVLVRSSKFSLECWKFLVENKADVLLEDHGNQTSISSLKGEKTGVITDAVIFAIRVYGNESMNKVKNIIWLVVSSLNCEVVEDLCKWCNENIKCNLGNLKVNNLTLLDAGLKNDDGSVAEYVFNTLICKSILSSPPDTCIHNLVTQNNSDENGMIDLITYLCECYPSLVDYQNDKGQTALCVRGLNAVFVKHLVRLGANINYWDMNGNTPLHWAILNHNTDLIFPTALLQELLDCGANVNAENSQGETPLLLVTQLKYKFDTYDCFTRLISVENVDLHKKYYSDNTILDLILPHVSAQQFEEIKAFCSLKSCDNLPHVKNGEGKSPLQIADDNFQRQKDVKESLHYTNI